ncbi:hypothetical protein B5V00_12945 [Geothermobacter hydrogeniphilus]|uniref:DUF3135 domain-containing protein n=2 Tax=Geothermobacter hydrogeniphilus TaxID=1969733 RepID=A0A1X0XXK2_9BACT|nr:hypothetical protein B5V00_12945 [Geothermobacter hydrogeniphilus]
MTGAGSGLNALPREKERPACRHNRRRYPMLPQVDDTRAIIDRLSALTDTDPEQFERESRAIIEQTIASFPEHHRHRARGLQFRIDNALAQCSDPLSRMNKMVEIFWEQFRQFHDILHDPEKVLNERESNREVCRVIPLRRSATRQAG